MKHWWMERSARERLTLGTGAVVLLLILLWGLVWAPLQDSLARRATALESQQQTLQWMQSVAAELPRLRSGQRDAAEPATSLLGLLESSARQAGLRQRIVRMEPEGEGSVRLNLRQVDFDHTIQWLAQLQNQGIAVRDGQFVLADAPGTVNASLTLQR